MKYIVVVELKHGVIDTNLLETDDLKEAFEKLYDTWHYLTTNERKNLESLMILESWNPDEDAPDHYDGNPVLDCTRAYRPADRYADSWYGGEVDYEYVEECQDHGIPMDELLRLIKDYSEGLQQKLDQDGDNETNAVQATIDELEEV